MTTSAPPSARATPTRRFLVRVRYALGVLPDAVLALRDGARGAPGQAAERARRRVRSLGISCPDRPVTAARVAVHAVLGLGLGAWAWFLAWSAVSGFARGPLYGLVDPGPYDHSWGGPNVVGAWAAHAWVWTATLPVAAALWWGLASLHARLTRQLLGDGLPRWALSVSGVLLVAVVLFLRAWIHQL